jgi:transcriptional regulator with XRE-family HTH domain
VTSVTDHDRNCQRRVKPITAHEQMRRQLGYSVTSLARALGFSHPYVSRVEAGLQKPSARYCAAVSELLGVPVELIFPADAA